MRHRVPTQGLRQHSRPRRVASVDTYLRFAEATDRLDLYEKGGKDLLELLAEAPESSFEAASRGLVNKDPRGTGPTGVSGAKRAWTNE